MVERDNGTAVDEDAAGATERLGFEKQSIHPVLDRGTAPETFNLEAYDIDSELKQFLENPLVINQLKRVDTVYEVPAAQTNTILDAILREDGPVAVSSLMDSVYFDSGAELKEAIFVLENRNLIETRNIGGNEHVAFHHGGLDAVRRARYRDRLTVRMIEDKMDRQPKHDPLVA